MYFRVGSDHHVRCAECGRTGPNDLNHGAIHVRVGNALVALLCGDCLGVAEKKVMAAFPHRSIVEVDEEGREVACG